MKKTEFKQLLEQLLLEVKIENEIKDYIKDFAGYSNAVKNVEEKNKKLIIHLKDENVFGELSRVLKKKYLDGLSKIVKKEYKNASSPVYSSKNLTIIFKI